ncbi:MAG: glycosyltransferase [Candidatus Aminicenantes bacterium]|nr:glycosyltransferase [Candidatus Aminicenantes bacterium]NIM78672.1 glycosyltransferase [Candidatus Aminicenantes bacterium]NIN17919.1 glycosyltransferase [Candidatus Aminicenantes bacterium]NIN41822.1 glycosyltransferase [Candidatus Aminicenantes bacterium]NIN84574.1 glycosyltransferase [Candidatus Aminicenantes bacterium]
MTAVQVVILFFSALSAAFWIWEIYVVLRTLHTMPLVEKLPESPIKNPPKISVLIPACNEKETLGKAMELRLQDNYPNLEFILIDDRSNDGTREVAREIAARDKRVKLVCIDELPDGWLGKIHALYQGLKHASGDWLLLSDADVHVKPGTLNRVMNYCLSENLDHLAVVPEFYKTNFFMDTALTVFLKALVVMSRSWKIKDKNSRAFGGAGAFTMVKRTALEKTKGFEWLKLEVVDDLTLGQMVKRSSGNSDMINGRGYVGVQWYRTFAEMAIGMGRAMVVGSGNLNFIQLFAVGLLGFILDMMPYIILVPMGVPYLPLAGAVLSLLTFLAAILVNRLIGLPLVSAFFLPLGNILMFFIGLWAGITASIKRGIVWRGKFYSRKELKKGRRFSF